MILEKYQIMKNYILTIATLLFLISCGKSEKSIEPEKIQDTIAVNPKEIEIKEVETPIYNYEKDSDFSKELDLILLSKVATNLKINYEDIETDKTSSIVYNDDTAFFTITYVAKKWKEGIENWEENDGDYLERIYVFVNKSNGRIIDKVLDDESCVYENEALKVEKTEIFKKLIKLNENITGIMLSTLYYVSAHDVGYDETKFSILALDGNKIIKLVYAYPIQIENSDSLDGDVLEKETRNSTISISDSATNGFFDLKISKFFKYEKGKISDFENENNDKIIHKNKKESQVLKFNGKIYPFDLKDRLRFL